MTNWKIATVVAVVAAVAAGFMAYRYRKQILPAAGLPSPGASKPAGDQNGLAALQVKMGSKAVAESSKQAQLGEVRAHARAAEKKMVKA